LTFFLSKQPHHTHRFVIDSDSQDEVCLGCGKLKGKKDVRENKYRAKRTEYKGMFYDSMREAQYAAELDLLLRAGKILSWERQYPVRIEIEGQHILTHKVDFRVQNHDGSYELHEVKGVATPDWKIRRQLLELVWLPKHLDHTYHVIR
jgi:Protein of unknown function (DUF1064)